MSDTETLLIANMGGPESPEEIPRFMNAIFADPAILPVPRMVRPLLARTIVAARRSRVQDRYAQIGGFSPVAEWTRRLRKGVESALAIVRDEVERLSKALMQKKAWANGEEIPLTQKECMLLKVLVEAEGQVVSRETVLDRVWGYDRYPSSRTIDNLVLRLRRYFEDDPKNPAYLQTVYGAGYRFVREKGEGGD